MKKLPIQDEVYLVKYGSLSMSKKGSAPYEYQEGVYCHPDGIVLVTTFENYTRADFYVNGFHYIRTIRKELSFGEVRHFCRIFLLDVLNNRTNDD